MVTKKSLGFAWWVFNHGDAKGPQRAHRKRVSHRKAQCPLCFQLRASVVKKTFCICNKVFRHLSKYINTKKIELVV